MSAPPSQPPKGTRHRIKLRHHAPLPSPSPLEIELASLPALIKAHFTKWTNGARDFQLQCMRAQILKTDVLLHAATGAGKTGIAAGPHLLPSSKGKVTLMVSPLLALEDEQVATFRDEFGLKAIAINSTNGGCSPTILAAVLAGEWQIVLLSPEMLVSPVFIDEVLRKPAFGPRVLSVFIDEAHCISHWGNSFRKAYNSVGMVRAFLPRNTSFVAVTATLTEKVHQDLITKLGFNHANYLFVNIGNDRPNVAQVVRAMEHPINSFRDLDFLVPDVMVSQLDIKKTFLYSDDIKAGSNIVDKLNSRVDLKYQHYGLVRPYNATMSKEYRNCVMKLFRAGKVRILVCTDAAGMGCDIPDVDMVVQWKVPENLSSWVQRAGRAARAPGRSGLALMIVEKASFEVVAMPAIAAASSKTPLLGVGSQRPNHGAKQSRQQSRRGVGSALKNGVKFAQAHGQQRGSYGGLHDTIIRLDETVISPEALRDAIGEGIYAYIQATNCRRQILRMVFRNDPSVLDPRICCDLCNAKLFDEVRPSKPLPATRQKAIKRGVPVDSVRSALYKWRRTVKASHFPRAIWGPQAILDDTACELLSSIGTVDSEDELAALLRTRWAWWDKLGHELYTFLHALDIPPLPKAKRTARKQQEATPGEPSKRARLAPSMSRQPKKGPEPIVFETSAYDSFFSQLTSSRPSPK